MTADVSTAPGGESLLQMIYLGSALDPNSATQDKDVLHCSPEKEMLEILSTKE